MNGYPVKSAFLSAILGLFILGAGVPVAAGAEIATKQAVAVPTQAVAVEAIANLADPRKLATLGVRGANPRVQKITYWLFIVRRNGGSLEAAIDAAFARFGWTGTPQGDETKLTLIRNFKRAENLGCFDAEGLEEMRRGHSPTVKQGVFIGQEMSVDHVIPRAAAPELDNVLANLELKPLRMNVSKSAKLEPRQIEFARRFVAAGIISAERVPWAAPFDGKTIPRTSTSSATRTTSNQSPVNGSQFVTPVAGTIVGSSRSPVFHKASCTSVSKMVAANLVTYSGRDEAIEAGKRPCPNCKP
jgi:hypothetical protein